MPAPLIPAIWSRAFRLTATIIAAALALLALPLAGVAGASLVAESTLSEYQVRPGDEVDIQVVNALCIGSSPSLFTGTLDVSWNGGNDIARIQITGGDGQQTIVVPADAEQGSAFIRFSTDHNQSCSGEFQIDGITVNGATATELSVAIDPTPTLFGTTGHAVATVTANGMPINVGTVTFSARRDATTIDLPDQSAGVHDEGKATISLPADVRVGDDITVTANYSDGDGGTTFADSTGTATWTVGKAASTVSPNDTAYTITKGNRLTGTVTVPSPVYGYAPQGTVGITVDSTEISSEVTLVNGQADFDLDTTSLDAGTPYTVRFAYSGDTNLDAGTGTSNLAVLQASTVSVNSIDPSGQPTETRPVELAYAEQSTVNVTVADGNGQPLSTPVWVQMWDVTDSNNAVALPDAAEITGSGGISLRTTPAAGDRRLEARVRADSTFTTSASQPVDIVVTKAPTGVEMVLGDLPPAGTSTSLQALVYSKVVWQGVPPYSGDVAYWIDSDPDAVAADGQAPVGADGYIDLPAQTFSVGEHTVYVEFTDSSGNYADSDSGLQTFDVRYGSETTLTTPSSNIAFGDDIELTASVTATAGAPEPTGTVSFHIRSPYSDPVATGTLNNGEASVTLDSVEIRGGTHNVYAKYSGTVEIAESTSTAGSINVLKGASTATVDAEDIEYGEALTGTVTVTSDVGGYTPSGEISVAVANGPSTTAYLDSNGIAAFSFDSEDIGIGPQTIDASYDGDDSLEASDDSAAATVDPAVAVVEIAEVPESTPFGTTFDVTVQATTSTGVQFPSGTEVRLWDTTDPDNPVQLRTSPLNTISGTATLPVDPPAIGELSLTAEILANSPNISDGSSEPSTVTVTKPRTTSTTDVFNLYASIDYGEALPFEVTVTSLDQDGPLPTGTVTFHLGSEEAEPFATRTVIDGEADLVVNDLDVGQHTVFAVYSGDEFRLGSSSSTTVTITQTSASVAVSVDPSPPIANKPANLIARVSLVGGTPIRSTSLSPSQQSQAQRSVQSRSVQSLQSLGSANPSAQRGLFAHALVSQPYAQGTVEFFVNGISVGTAQLVNGVATLPYIFSGAGAASVSASYNGSPNVEATSEAGQLTVGVAPAAETVPPAPDSTSGVAPGAAPSSNPGRSGGSSASASAGSNSPMGTPLALTGSNPLLLVLLGAGLVAVGVMTLSARSRRSPSGPVAAQR